MLLGAGLWLCLMLAIALVVEFCRRSDPDVEIPLGRILQVHIEGDTKALLVLIGAKGTEPIADILMKEDEDNEVEVLAVVGERRHELIFTNETRDVVFALVPHLLVRTHLHIHRPTIYVLLLDQLQPKVDCVVARPQLRRVVVASPHALDLVCLEISQFEVETRIRG